MAEHNDYMEGIKQYFLVIRELHEMGYELIRVCPSVSPNGGISSGASKLSRTTKSRPITSTFSNRNRSLSSAATKRVSTTEVRLRTPISISMRNGVWVKASPAYAMHSQRWKE